MTAGDRGPPQDKNSYSYTKELENSFLDHIISSYRILKELLKISGGSYRLPHRLFLGMPYSIMAILASVSYTLRSDLRHDDNLFAYKSELSKDSPINGDFSAQELEKELTNIPFWTNANPEQKQEITDLINDIVSLSADTERRRQKIGVYLQQLAHG